MPKLTAQKGNKASLHVLGYQVIRKAIEIDDRVLETAQRESTKKTSAIFNHNEMNHRSDHKRRQRNLPLRSQVMKEFDQRVRGVIQTKVNTDLTPTDPVILHSRPGCQPQAAHCDYVPDEALKKVGVEQMPLAAIICLMPNTHLKIWPKSTRLAMTARCDLKKVKPISCEELELNPGDMIVFRGDFIHAGSGYDADNYRIHYYCDSKFVPRKTNRTWLIGDSGSDELRRIIQPDRALVKEPSVGSPGRDIKGVAEAAPIPGLSFFNPSKRFDLIKPLDTPAEENGPERGGEEPSAKHLRIR